MKKILRSVFTALSFTLCLTQANAQSVLLDSHSDGSGGNTWQITTSQPNELIIIAADGYGGGPFTNTPGNVTVNSSNATYITRSEWWMGDFWLSSIWAYEAPTAGTYTITCNEASLGVQAPFYFNYASCVYSTGGPLSLSNIFVGGNDSNKAMDSAIASIFPPQSNSWVYGTTAWNDNGGSGTLNWNGGLTELDHDYINDGLDCAQADSTIAVSALQTIMVTNLNANNPWATLTLIAVCPGYVCNLSSVTIDSLISGGCHDSLWGVVTGGRGALSYLWSPGGLTSDTIGGLCSGSYTLTVTDSAGCKDSAMITIPTPLGLNNVAKNNSAVNMYPNPFTQSFTVDVTTSQPAIVSLFNMLGENVGTWTLSSGHNVINTEQYPAGVYMMQAKTLDGVLISSQKLVKVAQ